jgi:RsiW-degrading membrane proteinase PrsW (M82 family)
VNLLLLIALSLGPVAFWLLYFYLKDRFEPEPLRWVLKVFILGMLVVLPVVVIETIAEVVTGPFLLVTVVAPTVEELGKFAVVYIWVFHDTEFSEPMDGIIYAVTAALGFASLENLLYITQYARISLSMGITVGVLRAILSVPGHALYSSIWGYALGVAKFRQGIRRNEIILAGLALAILLHALFNFLILNVFGFVILIVFLVPAMWWLFGRKVRDAEAL